MESTLKNFSPDLIKHTLCFCHHDGDILMLYRNNQPNKNLWNGLGGKIEVGETPLESAIREIEEESGLVVEDINQLGIVSWSYDRPDYIPYKIGGGMYVFWGEVNDVQRQAKQLHEVNTLEGKLSWKSKEWILDPKSKEVVENIRVFLPMMLESKKLDHHHFVYRESNNFIDHLIVE